MTQYLLAPPHCLEQAAALGLPLAHMAFSLMPDGRLHYGSLPSDCRRGLMLIGISSSPAEGADPRVAVREILSLCRSRQFGGVILDLECPPSPYLAGLIRRLDTELFQTHRGLFLPERYSAFSQRAFLYLSPAVSGGSLKGRLEEAVCHHGAHRLVLSLHRVREDFFLPAPEGKGQPLSQEELERRLRQLEPRVFFSKDLCAHYFTYMSRETGAHFILFDDSKSLEQKRALARDAGIRCFFWLYPEVESLLPELSL